MMIKVKTTGGAIVCLIVGILIGGGLTHTYYEKNKTDIVREMVRENECIESGNGKLIAEIDEEQWFNLESMPYYFYQTQLQSVVTADVDGDGKADSVAVDDVGGEYISRLIIYTADGSVREEVFEERAASSIVARDIDDDGKDEILLIRNIFGSMYGGAEIYLLKYLDKELIFLDDKIYAPNGELLFTLRDEFLGTTDASLIMLDDRTCLRIACVSEEDADKWMIYDTYLNNNKWVVEKEQVVEADYAIISELLRKSESDPFENLYLP